MPPLQCDRSFLIPGAESETMMMVTNTGFVILGLVSLIFIVIFTFRLATSGGDDEMKKKSRKMLLYGVLALIASIILLVLNNFVQC